MSQSIQGNAVLGGCEYMELSKATRSESDPIISTTTKKDAFQIVKLVLGAACFLGILAIALGLVMFCVRSASSPLSTASDFKADKPASAPAPFTIRFVYTTPMTDEQRMVFEEAKARWERLIVKDFFNTVRAAKGLSICNQPPLEHDLFIEDLVIFAGISKIDGPGRILGQAGPCGFDNAGRIRVGVMKFDEDDIGNHFPQTVRHEMGHVLGIGSVWEDRRLVSPEGENPIRYLGSHGNEGHRSIGGGGEFALVETEGGSGTARSHWKDSEYPDEMMTGFLSSQSLQPISMLTVLALADIGFTVDTSKADDFQARVDSQEDEAFVVPPLEGRRRRLRAVKDDAIQIHDDLYHGPLYRFPEENELQIASM